MILPKKRYLVTGGTGFLGRALVRGLVAAGHFVRVLDDDSRGKASTLKDVAQEIEFIRGDVRNAEIVARACQSMDSVCHLAFINGTEFFYKIPERVLEVGVKGMMNVLDACIAHQVPELFLMSSSEVYQTPAQVPTDETVPLLIPDPLNPRYSYAGGKIISELLAINYGRKFFEKVLIVRPHNVFGPQMGFEHVIPQFCMRLQKLLQSGQSQPISFPIQGSGTETRAFVYVDDFTEGVLKVLEKGNHLDIYHIGTEEERTIREVAESVAHAFGVTLQIIPGPSALGGTPRRCPDISKAKALGYVPKVGFEEAISKTVEWYRAQNPS